MPYKAVLRAIAASVALVATTLAMAVHPIHAQAATNRDVTGKVVASSGGTPLARAVVTLGGTKYGAETKDDGTFLIRGVVPGTYPIQARRIGYRSITREITVGTGNASIELALEYVPTQLEEVVITGSLSNVTAKSVPSAVTIVTSEEIEARGPIKTEKIFKTVPGTSMSADGQFNYGATINIRGGNSIYSSTAKILIDGVEAAADYAINDVSPETIERIEVFRGPQASTIYGSAASGGLIHIITKKGEYTSNPHPQLEAKLSAGWVETRSKYGTGAPITENGITVTGGGKSVSYRAGASYSTQGDWVKNGFERSPNAFANIRTSQGDLQLELGLRYSKRGYGWLYNPAAEEIAPTIFHGLNDTRERNDDQTQALNLHAIYQARPNWRHEITAGFDRHSYEYNSTLPRDDLGTNYVWTDESSTPSVKYHMGWDAKLGRKISSALVLGVDYSANHYLGYYWEGIGDPNDGAIPADPDARADVYRTYLNSLALYGQEVIGLGENLFLTLGLRGDRQRATTVDQGFTWSPRVGLAYSRAFGNVTAKFRGSYGTVPSPIPANALTGENFPNWIAHPNPNIRPPQLAGADVGLELYFGRKFSVAATYFNQRPKDQIDFVTLDPDSAGNVVGIYQNIGEIHNTGWELEGRLYLDRFTLVGSFSPVNSRITKLGPDYSGALVVGDPLINVPDWTASVSAGLNLPSTSIVLTANSSGEHLNYAYLKLYAAQEAGSYDPSEDREKYIVDYPAVTKFNLNLSHEVTRRIQVFLAVRDLFNTGKSETADYYVNKSRVSRFGVRVRF